MTSLRYRKPEPTNVQGTCVVCGWRKQVQKAANLYRALCRVCHHERHGMRRDPGSRGRSYAWAKKDVCEGCGFVPQHPCQLDVDHIDGDRSNNQSSNWQTLCANCHRLKTFLAGDYAPREERGLQ